MKTIVNLEFPIEPFNTMVRDGSAGKVLAEILEDIKPETILFFANNGCRGAIMVVDIDDPARIPFIAEPFFLKFNARCEFNPAMTPADLMRAGLDQLGKKWG
jgi:hypothetical protein